MVAMYSLRQLILGVCFVAQFCAVAVVSLFIIGLSNLHNNEILLDREGFLSREEVVSNVMSYALGGSIAVTVAATMIFFVNYAVFVMQDINGKKAATIFALICWLWMMFLVLYTGFDCYLKYGANLPA